MCSEGTQSPKPELGGGLGLQNSFKGQQDPNCSYHQEAAIPKARSWDRENTQPGTYEMICFKGGARVFTSVWSYWTNSRRQVVFNLHIQAFPGSMGLRVKGYVVDLWFNGPQDSGL